jgi:hypothetical protein
MHRLSLNIEEVMRFPNGLSIKENLEFFSLGKSDIVQLCFHL